MKKNKNSLATFVILKEAIRENKFNEFKKLIEESEFDVTLRDEKRRTLLHYAAQTGYVDFVKYLLNKQEEKYLPEDDKLESPLHLAARGERLKVIKFFLKKKPEFINAFQNKNAKGRTPLDLLNAKHSAFVQSKFPNYVCIVKSKGPVKKRKQKTISADIRTTDQSSNPFAEVIPPILKKEADKKDKIKQFLSSSSQFFNVWVKKEKLVKNVNTRARSASDIERAIGSVNIKRCNSVNVMTENNGSISRVRSNSVGYLFSSEISNTTSGYNFEEQTLDDLKVAAHSLPSLPEDYTNFSLAPSQKISNQKNSFNRGNNIYKTFLHLTENNTQSDIDKPTSVNKASKYPEEKITSEYSNDRKVSFTLK